eukprot:TRINITY_DN46656_c0_g1_i1.p1 TRINITY_DN46656_c0_g1~~TRINITY_DN46656_c0_g1_i1.p1  ORF type:complete len:111 (-),score=1.72 TRINITY_DN46656_c0_g1_i1:338-670(-)
MLLNMPERKAVNERKTSHYHYLVTKTYHQCQLSHCRYVKRQYNSVLRQTRTDLETRLPMPTMSKRLTTMTNINLKDFNSSTPLLSHSNLVSKLKIVGPQSPPSRTRTDLI